MVLTKVAVGMVGRFLMFGHSFWHNKVAFMECAAMRRKAPKTYAYQGVDWTLCDAPKPGKRPVRFLRVTEPVGGA